MADLFKKLADMFKNLADMFKKMADMFKKRGQFSNVRLLVFRRGEIDRRSLRGAAVNY